MEIDTNPVVATTVDLYEMEDHTFTIGVNLTVTVPNVSKPNANHMVKYANSICPYSRALRNNVRIEINVEN
ncbi:hypothetical protein AB1I58_07235 [Enterococcus hirae]|nr:OsmC family protein [Enterococcus hirae]